MIVSHYLLMPALRIAVRALVALLLVIAAIASGWSGLLIMAGLVLLALAAQLLITGRARWAFITGPLPRGYGAGAIAAAVAVFIAGGAASSPAPAVAAAPAPTITRTATATVTTTATETTTATATVTETATAPPPPPAAAQVAPAAAAPVPTSAPPPPPAPVATQAPAPAAFYANCDAVRAAGAAPIRTGDPGYSRKLDRDGDGVACET